MSPILDRHACQSQHKNDPDTRFLCRGLPTQPYHPQPQPCCTAAPPLSCHRHPSCSCHCCCEHTVQQQHWHDGQAAGEQQSSNSGTAAATAAACHHSHPCHPPCPCRPTCCCCRPCPHLSGVTESCRGYALTLTPSSTLVHPRPPSSTLVHPRPPLLVTALTIVIVPLLALTPVRPHRCQRISSSPSSTTAAAVNEGRHHVVIIVDHCDKDTITATIIDCRQHC